MKCSGAEHVINLFSYGLDYGLYLSAATGCVVLGGKYSSVTTSVYISASSTDNTILDASSSTITDASEAGNNIVVGKFGLRPPRGVTGERPLASSARGGCDVV